MAGPYYVRSTDGNDGDSGLTWALAKATLAGALAVAAAGERIWVSQVHAESLAGVITLTSAGTGAAPIEILCGNDAAAPPTALATTATVSTTGANALTFGAGTATVYGITFSAGSTSSQANVQIPTAASAWDFEACGFTLSNTNAGSLVALGANANQIAIHLKNVTITLGAAGQSIRIRSGLWWKGGASRGRHPPPPSR